MRSPARMRWPVVETGRNSVRPSTMPRMSASMRLDKKLPDGPPEGRRVVRAIVPRAGQLHPPLRPFPGVVKALRVDYGNDFVVRRDQAQQRRGDLRRALDRVERVLEHQAHRKERVMVLP